MNILEHAYKSLGMPLPWKFFSVRDSRTLFSLVPNLQKYPASHHALEDCRRQINLLWDSLEYLRVPANKSAMGQSGILTSQGVGMIIGVCGLIGAGKDTIADYLVNIHEFRRDSFAATLKDAVAAVFGWDRDMLEGRTRSSGENSLMSGGATDWVALSPHAGCCSTGVPKYAGKDSTTMCG